MKIEYRRNYVYKKPYTAICNGVQGSGDTKSEAKAELIRWLDIMGNLKWVDVITDREVKTA